MHRPPCGVLVAFVAIAGVVGGGVLVACHGLRVGALPLALGLLLLAAAAWSAAFAPSADRCAASVPIPP